MPTGKQTLFVDETELCRRLRVRAEDALYLPHWENLIQFPRPDALFGNKRYFRAVLLWFYQQYRIENAERRVLADVPAPILMTPGETASALGITLAEFREALPTLEKQGFTPHDPRFSNRRFLPAVVQWLDQRHGISDHEAASHQYPMTSSKRGRW